MPDARFAPLAGQVLGVPEQYFNVHLMRRDVPHGAGL